MIDHGFVTVTFRVDAVTKSNMARAAAAEGIPMSELLREIAQLSWGDGVFREKPVVVAHIDNPRATPIGRFCPWPIPKPPKETIGDLHRRGFKAAAIAARLRRPYVEVVREIEYGSTS